MATSKQDRTALTRIAAPLRQQVLELLREAIASGDFEPGARLSERELCDRYEVSRTVIRETLRHLEAERLVTMIPHQGPVVAVLTKEDVAALYEVRGVLEALAARLFTERATPEQVQELTTIFEGFQALTVNGVKGEDEVRQALDLKDSFYALLIQGADNQDLANLLRTLHARTQLLRRATVASPSMSSQTTEGLRKLVEAIGRGDSQGAYDASVDHLEHAAQVALTEVEDPYAASEAVGR